MLKDWRIGYLVEDKGKDTLDEILEEILSNMEMRLALSGTSLVKEREEN